MPDLIEIPGGLDIPLAYTVPMPVDKLKELLGRLSLHYWQPDRPAEHFTMIMADYIDALGLYPAVYVERACTEHLRRGGNFFPKMSELIAIMETNNPRLKAEAKRLDKARQERVALELSGAIETNPAMQAQLAAIAKASVK